jgi:hypothetical protein
MPSEKQITAIQVLHPLIAGSSNMITKHLLPVRHDFDASRTRVSQIARFGLNQTEMLRMLPEMASISRKKTPDHARLLSSAC